MTEAIVLDAQRPCALRSRRTPWAPAVATSTDALLGGLLYLGGMLIMAWNVVMTVRAGKVAVAPVPPVAAAHA